MPIYVYKNTQVANVVHLDFIGDWTIEELHQKAILCLGFLSDPAPSSTIIADLTQNGVVPFGLINANRRILSLSPHLRATVLIIKAPALIRAVIEVSQRMFGYLPQFPRVKFVNSILEAQALLAPQ